MGFLTRIREWYQSPPSLWKPTSPQPDPPRLVVVNDPLPNVSGPRDQTVQPIETRQPAAQSQTLKFPLQQIVLANSQAQNLANTTPATVVCLECELFNKAIADASLDFAGDVLIDSLKYGSIIAANSANVLGPVKAATALVEPAADLYYAHKFSQAGDDYASAISYTNAAKSATVGIASVALGTGTVLLVGLFAPEIVAVGAAALVAAGAAMLTRRILK